MKKLIALVVVLFSYFNAYADVSPEDLAVGQVWYMPGLVVDGAKPPELPYQYGKIILEFKGVSYQYCVQPGEPWTFFVIQSYPGVLLLNYHLDLGIWCDPGKTYHHRWSYTFTRAADQTIIDSDEDGTLDDKDPFPYDENFPDDKDLGSHCPD